jgi:ribonuclease HI
MLDYGASHKLMPKAIMEKLGLEITRTYRDLYSFDSRKVRCLGMIKDLVVNLAQVLVKSILMDVFFVDVPSKYGMVLSKFWCAKLRGSLQLDMTYAANPIFGGQFNRLYRETRLAYTVSDPQNPNNYPVYIIDKDIGNYILSLDDDFHDCIEEENKKLEKIQKNVNTLKGIWNFVFDGASSREGEGVGVLFVAPREEYFIPFSYKLQWEIDCTNSICEYKALVLGLEVAKKLKIKYLIVYGDEKLIVKKIKRQYQDKHLRLRSYNNCAWDLIENFFSSFNFHHIPRMENQQADSLAKEATNFLIPIVLKIKYHIEMRHRPSIPNNLQHW